MFFQLHNYAFDYQDGFFVKGQRSRVECGIRNAECGMFFYLKWFKGVERLREVKKFNIKPVSTIKKSTIICDRKIIRYASVLR